MPELEALTKDLSRYLDEYGWDWGLIRKVVNRAYGTNYSIRQLKKFYNKLKPK